MDVDAQLSDLMSQSAASDSFDSNRSGNAKSRTRQLVGAAEGSEGFEVSP